MNRRFLNNNIGQSSNVLVIEILLWAIGVMLFVWTAPNFIPEKYYYDGRSIMARFYGVNEFMGQEDQSYDRVSQVYLFLGIDEKVSFDAQRIIGGMWAYLMLMLTFYGLARHKALSWFALSLPLIISYFVYMGQLSKEHFPLIVIGALLFRFYSAGFALVAAFIALISYAALFREYWFLVGLFWGGLLLFDKIKMAKWKQFVLIIIGLFIISYFHILFRGIGLTLMRENVNFMREGAADAQTAFFNIFPASNPFYDVANMGYSGGVLGLPFLMGYVGLTAILFQVYQPIFIVFFVIAGRRLWRMELSPAVNKLRYGYLLWISFFIVQTMFEPDLGSYLRHQMPFVPLIISIFWFSSEARLLKFDSAVGARVAYRRKIATRLTG